MKIKFGDQTFDYQNVSIFINTIQRQGTPAEYVNLIYSIMCLSLISACKSCWMSNYSLLCFDHDHIGYYNTSDHIYTKSYNYIAMNVEKKRKVVLEPRTQTIDSSDK